MSDIGFNDILPHSDEAENAVIASMFFNADAIFKAQEFITEADFYKKENALLFQAMVALNEEGSQIDLVTLIEKLRKNDTLEKVGGIARVTHVANAISEARNVSHYAKIIQEKSVLRRVIATNKSIISRCYDDTEPVETILEDAEKAVLSISKDRERGGLIPVSKTIGEVIEKIELIARQEDALTGVASGFADLDAITNGWQSSDFIIVAARPAMGKTAFCLNMAANAAIEHGKKVAIFSLEMSHEQLVQRLISAQAEVSQDVLRSGNVPPEAWSGLLHELGPLSSAPLYIDDTAGISIRELRAKANRMQAEHGVDLIIIDYLQLMSGGANSENRQQEVSQISRSLKALARDLNVPVIALSQLSRSVEQQKDKRPQLSHLRESGSLEQDADMVLFIYRDEYYDNASEDLGVAEIIIAKHRNGATGTVKLAFRKEFTKFSNLAYRSYD